MKLRNYENIKILKNVNNPIMFLGFPLKLAYLYIGGITLGFMSAFAISTMHVHWAYNIIIPVIIITISVTSISIFYKKYGINGFYLQQEDKYMPNEISGDMSFRQYIEFRKDKKNKK